MLQKLKNNVIYFLVCKNIMCEKVYKYHMCYTSTLHQIQIVIHVITILLPDCFLYGYLIIVHKIL